LTPSGWRKNEPYQVQKFRKVRFKRVIRPGEKLKIEVTPKKIEEGSYAFRILVEDELACNGVLFVKDPTQQIRRRKHREEGFKGHHRPYRKNNDR
jgi:3-hydroxymyristoyl/3-hydroxydecanoyl-(acyl carrier protein) dehydratase